MTGPRHDISFVAELLSQGRPITEIAKQVGVCALTIKNYAARLSVSTAESVMGEKKARQALRVAKVSELAQQGKVIKEICDDIGLCAAVVHKCAKQNGIEINRGQDSVRFPSQKTVSIISMFRQGVNIVNIAKKFNVTRQAIDQTLKKHGVTRSEGGKAKSAAQKKQARKIAAEAKAMRMYGLPLAVVKELRESKVIQAYREQKRNAFSRGKEWNIDFASWFSVWQASGKLHLRGVGVGRYVMSRICDDGAYELGNVHIQLATDNSREAVKQWAGKTKENRGVFCLYPGRNKAWLATAGGERIGYFETESEAVEARDKFMIQHGIETTSGFGNGKGYSKTKRGNYVMQCAGAKNTTHKTAEEARAAYLAAVEKINASKQKATA